MLDYIVLGQIPGTNLQLGFITVLTLFDLGLAAYVLQKYHPQKVKAFTDRWNESERNFWNRAGNIKPSGKRLMKKLTRLGHDVLSPKLKFLK